MDGGDRNIKGYNIEEKESKALGLKVLAIEGVVILILAAIILTTLNYLGIFSFSKLNPFSPKPDNKEEKQVQSLVPITKPTNVPTPKILLSISCPVPRAQCSSGKAVVELVEGQQLYGVKFSNITKDSKIIASIGGKKENLSPNIFLLTSASAGIEVRYVLSGEFSLVDTASSAASIEEGQMIGSFNSSVNELTIYTTSTLTKKPIQLIISKSGNYLTNTEGL